MPIFDEISCETTRTVSVDTAKEISMKDREKRHEISYKYFGGLT